MNKQNLRGEPVVILLIEDNEAHAEMVIRSFEDNGVANNIYHVADGELALDYLFRRGEYINPEDSPRPHIILLDLRLPRVDGLEVAKIVKEDADLKTIPIVILTTSKMDEDIHTAYKNHVNSYLVKPVDFEKFLQLMQDLEFYWLAWNVNSQDD